MLNHGEKIIKEKILKAKSQDEIIKIYQNENISMNIVNDKEVMEHIKSYIKIEEDKNAGHIYIRKKENANEEYMNYASEKIKEMALTNK